MEAFIMLDEGAKRESIDQAAEDFGMPMGPIELADTIGLDVATSVGAELGPFLGLEIPKQLDELAKSGKRGKKDGQGLYTWENGKPKKPEVDPKYVPPADIEDRMILPMLNEAVACLHDRVVDDADLLDAGVIFGTGFAPFRGGPIRYIRDAGVDAIKAKLDALAASHGNRFTPRPGWDAPELRRAPSGPQVDKAA
jgi:3-hydroxyacyl-CoA dehydrogenase/enoyl-CoA hydratase/3-hydroxybutyryl-CoA epimerase